MLKRPNLSRILPSTLLVLLSACSTIYQPTNKAITTIDEDKGYRRLNNERWEQVGDTLILLSFSGGGTRAAALSYGVMQELRDTIVIRDGQETRLLDDVDIISSVSGGSFTAAYYGLYRERLFMDFEDDFLRQGVQTALIRKMFNPANWMRSATRGFDRTEIAIDHYDRTIFKGATFSDISANGPPYIDINATDLTTGQRFTFGQELFDLICTDLGSYSVARAVTASSAVPVVFPTIVLENHADQCDISDTWEWEKLASAQAEGVAQATLIEGLKSYRDVKSRKYIHLVDGGIADNLGLRTIIDRIEGLGNDHFHFVQDNGIRNILIVLVNAEVKRKRVIEKTAEKPSASDTMSAYTSAQMNRYNQETKDRLRENLEKFKARTQSLGLDTQVFYTEVSFDQVQAEEINRFLNSMPTSLELDDVDVDKLILTGQILLRHDPDFMLLKTRKGAILAPGSVSDQEVCKAFGEAVCESAPVITPD